MLAEFWLSFPLKTAHSLQGRHFSFQNTLARPLVNTHGRPWMHKGTHIFHRAQQKMSSELQPECSVKLDMSKPLNTNKLRNLDV